MNDSEFVVDVSKREVVYQNIRNVFLRSQVYFVSDFLYVKLIFLIRTLDDG